MPAEPVTYAFTEGWTDSMTTRLKAIEVTVVGGGRIGQVVRGSIEGCEQTSTFRFEPDTGPTTSLGLRKATAASFVGRLIRPTYIVEQEGRSDTIQENVGENLIYFAVSGNVGGQQITARQDWDESVQVTADGDEIGRFVPGEWFDQTEVRTALAPGAPQFGLLMLLPFVHRIYSDETELIGALFE